MVIVSMGAPPATRCWGSRAAGASDRQSWVERKKKSRDAIER